MPHVACFCGQRFSFSGELGACPRCGECVAVGRVSAEEERQMRNEMERLLASLRVRDRS
jgi:hypothetical protein